MVGKRGGNKREGQEEVMRRWELGAGKGPHNTAEMTGVGEVRKGIQGPRQSWMERRRRDLKLDDGLDGK